jgi:hypothetical protein
MEQGRPEDNLEPRVVVRRSDWQRIKGALASVSAARPNLAVWYALAFGVAAATGASVLPVAAARDLPPWVTPMYVCVALSSGIVGGVLVWLERTIGGAIRARLQDVELEMSEAEHVLEEPPQEP